MDTDRLPEEKARGITIDLGFAPLGCPTAAALGRRRPRARAVRPQHGRRRDRDRPRPARDRRRRGRHAADARAPRDPAPARHRARRRRADQGRLVDDEALELALEEARELVPDADAGAVGARRARASTSSGRARARRGARGAAQGRRCRAAPGRPRLHACRHRHGRHRDAVVGPIGEGDQLRVEPRGLEARVRSVQVHDERSSGRRRPARRGRAGGSGAHPAFARGDALTAPGRLPGRATGSTSPLGEPLDELPPRLMVHHGTSQTCCARRPRGRGLRAAAARAACRRRPRRPRRPAHVDDGRRRGRASIPLPPRRLDAGPARAARARRDRCDGILPRSAPRRCATSASSSRRRAAPATGSSRRDWLDELRAELRRARSPPPTRATPASTRRPRRGRRRSCRCSGSSGAARGSTCRARRPQAAGGEELLAELEASPASTPVKVDDTGARPAARAGGQARPARRRRSPSAQSAYERARAALVEECTAAGAITLARFRDLLGRRAARARSSCSSGSTPTASPAATASERVLRRGVT